MKNKQNIYHAKALIIDIGDSKGQNDSNCVTNY